MPKCKTCGSKYSIWSARGDGLCKACGGTADEAKKQEAERKETERKAQVLETAKKNIDLIVKAATDKQPLAFTFINRGITTKKSSGLLGVAVGGALGGMAGAMVGNALTGGGSTDHSGELGILVVTEDQVIIVHFPSPFLSEVGKISSDHLELFRTRLDSHKAGRKTFDIRRSQLARPSNAFVTLGTGPDAFSFQKSDLYVNDTLHDLPGISAIHGVIAELGALVTPADFIAKLERRENPMPDGQFVGLEDGGKYMAEVFGLLLQHRNRDTLVQNLTCLDSSVKTSLEARLSDEASRVGSSTTKLRVAIAIAVVGGIGVVLTLGDALCFFAVLCLIAGVIMSIAGANRLRRDIWCRNALKNEFMGS